MLVEIVLVNYFVLMDIFSVLAEQVRDYLILCLCQKNFLMKRLALYKVGMCGWANVCDVKQLPE